jgi:hypothetical protein
MTIAAPALLLAMALGASAFAQEKKPDTFGTQNHHDMSGSMSGMDKDMLQMMGSCEGMMQNKSNKV